MENVAVCPAFTVWLIGWVPMEGDGSDFSEPFTLLALVKPTHPVWTRHASNMRGAIAREHQLWRRKEFDALGWVASLIRTIRLGAW